MEPAMQDTFDAAPDPADDAVAVARRFWQLMAGNDFDAVGAVLADDFVLDWPQSRERIRGRARFAAVNREYPAHGIWRFTVRSLFGSADEAVSEVEITDGVQHARALSFFRIEGGLITRMREFWPEDYAAPGNRAQWVEPYEDAADD
jgi:ketosteroid isomerase-like protein